MKIRKILTAILVFVIASGMLCSCMGKPQKKAKLDDYDPDSVDPAEVSVDYSEVEDYDVADDTQENYEEFAFNMFNRCAEEAVDENMMISPASMLFALGMTAGGARNNTLTEMADTLCPGSTPEEMQAFSLYYMNQLMGMSEEQLNVANAVWVNDDRIGSDLNEDYADFVEDQYHGEITRESFGPSTVNHINDWVDDVTDGMIDRVIEEITDDCALVLVNAITFDCEWDTPYEDYQVEDMTFYGVNGEEDVSMLCDVESNYYESDIATAFSKVYAGRNFQFIGILPKDENMSISEFASNFSAEDYQALINGRYVGECDVYTRLPEFSFDYDRDISDDLRTLGMHDAFSAGNADFQNIAQLSNGNNLYISRVLHNSHIEVNQNGTRAAAATTVLMDEATSCEPFEVEVFYVYLDRPFMFIIIDTDTGLPLFMGTVNHIAE